MPRVRVPPLVALDLGLHVDVLGLLEGLEPLAAELAADPRLLEAAERDEIAYRRTVSDWRAAGRPKQMSGAGAPTGRAS